MNRLLAILWLLGGVGILVYEANGGRVRIRGLEAVSFAWFCFALAGYNFVRWYATYASAEDRKAQRLVEEARARRARERPREEPNPDFDFSDPPAPPSKDGPSSIQ